MLAWEMAEPPGQLLAVKSLTPIQVRGTPSRGCSTTFIHPSGLEVRDGFVSMLAEMQEMGVRTLDRMPQDGDDPRLRNKAPGDVRCRLAAEVIRAGFTGPGVPRTTREERTI